MSASKVVFIILVLVAVLFAVAMFVHPSSGSDERADTFPSKDHPKLTSLNSVVAPFAPKVKADGLLPAITIFDLSRVPSYTVRVLPDAAHQFRLAQFAAIPSKHCASVIYQPAGEGDHQDAEQTGRKEHPEAFSFLISSAGGTLTVERRLPLQTMTCTISLQTGK